MHRLAGLLAYAYAYDSLCIGSPACWPCSGCAARPSSAAAAATAASTAATLASARTAASKLVKVDAQASHSELLEAKKLRLCLLSKI